MSIKRKIGIIGLGLIGGSLALALKDTCDVTGFDSDAATVKYARDNGVCETVSDIGGLCECEVVFVCVPVAAMRATLDLAVECLGKKTVIADVASVKAPFESFAERIRYVGTHPMAGTELGGISRAKAHLFQNAYWIVTNDGADAEVVTDVIRMTGAIPLTMTATEHDRAVAEYSHVPHAVAYALVAAATESGVRPIAGSGFLDTTRIAQSDEKFWTTVFETNTQNVVSGIRSVIAELEKLDALLVNGRFEDVESYLAAARQKRIALNKTDLGGEALYVDLVDRVGEFERITGAIARAGINVTNIALVPGRDGASGALRLEFDDAETRDRAAKVLNAAAENKSNKKDKNEA